MLSFNYFMQLQDRVRESKLYTFNIFFEEPILPEVRVVCTPKSTALDSSFTAMFLHIL